MDASYAQAASKKPQTYVSMGSLNLPNTSDRAVNANTNFLSDVKHPSIHRQIREAVSCAKNMTDLLENLAGVVSQNSDCLGLWFALAKNRDHEGQLIYRSLLDPDSNALWNFVQTEVNVHQEQVLSSRDLVAIPIAAVGNALMVFSPISEGSEVRMVIASCFSTQQQATTRHLWLMSLVTDAIERWNMRVLLESQQNRVNEIQKSLMAMTAIGDGQNLNELGIAVSNHLKSILSARQVFFGLIAEHRERILLKSVSDVESFDETSSLAHQAEIVMNENASAKIPTLFSATDPENPSNVASLLSAAATTHCALIPIEENGRNVAAILVTINLSEGKEEQFSKQLNSIVKTIVPQILLAVRANENLFALTHRKVRHFLSASLVRNLALGIAGIAMLLCVPWPYRVSCDATLQPVKRRYVTAPFEGLLESTLAKSGDRVQAGELLATLDGETLRFELAGLNAELASARKKRDQALATRDIAESQIQKSEERRIESQIQSIEQRLAELEIRCPLDGIIVSGDLDKVEGAKLQLGQTLFEIGPLDQMLVEVKINETELRFVEVGANVALKFAAYPFRTWQGSIEKIHPRSEMIDGENVFVAEVSIPNPDGELQPGMRGQAKVENGWSLLGWIWLHRAANDVRYYFIW